MKHFKTIRLSLILFVFSILSASGLISFIFIYAFNFTEIYKSKTALLLLILSIICSIIIGTFLTVIFSAQVLKPLNEVIEATKKVGKGDFTSKIAVNNDKIPKDTEINQLIYSFNKMTDELSSIEILKKDFINNFSHEFKTPISSIIGYAKQLEYDDISDEEKKLYTSIIINESERLSTLSSNVLLLTKLESQAILTNKKEYQLDEQIRNVILLLQNNWEEKNISFDLNLENIQYYGNEDLLQHVWINLLDNAIKFSNENGVIKVSCYKYGYHIKIKIADSGIGMSDQTLNHIFDKFYQGDTSHSSKGNGLGLSLVNEIILLCNGKISVKSRLNHGTSFTILLPIEEG
jgi:signal transduction histidine kinase